MNVNDLMSMMTRLQQFSKQYAGKDARAEVMKLVQQNVISQQQLNELMQSASTLMNFMGLNSK